MRSSRLNQTQYYLDLTKLYYLDLTSFILPRLTRLSICYFVMAVHQYHTYIRLTLISQLLTLITLTRQFSYITFCFTYYIFQTVHSITRIHIPIAAYNIHPIILAQNFSLLNFTYTTLLRFFTSITLLIFTKAVHRYHCLPLQALNHGPLST